MSLGLVAIFIYYAFTLATERMARSGVAPPELVMPLSLPRASLVGSAYLMRCLRLERMPDFQEFSESSDQVPKMKCIGGICDLALSRHLPLYHQIGEKRPRNQSTECNPGFIIGRNADH